MMGYVGMSRYEKERKQEDAYIKAGNHDNPSLCTSLFMCYAAILLFVTTGDEILGHRTEKQEEHDRKTRGTCI